MTEKPLDLSSLDPSADGSLDELVRSITTRAAPELARREGTRGAFAILADWAVPALAAAAALAAISLVGLSTGGSVADLPPLAGVPEELGLNGPVAEWVMEGRTPTQEDLLLAMENDF